MKALIRNRSRRGFTLIELMIVVAIIGILAVLAIYGVSRYLKSAKTAEATNNVGQLGKNAQEAWSREKMSGVLVLPGGTSAIGQAMCLTALDTVPAGSAIPKAEKYVSAISEWGGDNLVGWKCLRYSIDQPQYYMYRYTSAVGASFNAAAFGDLDGNTTSSYFGMDGTVDTTTMQLVLAPAINVANETE